MNGKSGDNPRVRSSMTGDGSRNSVQRILGEDDVARLRKFGFVTIEKRHTKSWILRLLAGKKPHPTSVVQEALVGFGTGVVDRKTPRQDNHLTSDDPLEQLEVAGNPIDTVVVGRTSMKPVSVVKKRKKTSKKTPVQLKASLLGKDSRSRGKASLRRRPMRKRGLARKSRRTDKPTLIEEFFPAQGTPFGFGPSKLDVISPDHLVVVVFGTRVEFTHSAFTGSTGVENGPPAGNNTTASNSEDTNGAFMGLSESDSDGELPVSNGSKSSEGGRCVPHSGTAVLGTEGGTSAERPENYIPFLGPTLSPDDSPPRPTIVSPLVDARPVFVPSAERQARASELLALNVSSMDTTTGSEQQNDSGVNPSSAIRDKCSSRSSGEDQRKRKRTKRPYSDESDLPAPPAKSLKLQLAIAAPEHPPTVPTSVFSSPGSNKSASEKNELAPGSLFSPVSGPSGSSTSKQLKLQRQSGDAIGFAFGPENTVNERPSKKIAKKSKEAPGNSNVNHAELVVGFEQQAGSTSSSSASAHKGQPSSLLPGLKALFTPPPSKRRNVASPLNASSISQCEDNLPPRIKSYYTSVQSAQNARRKRPIDEAQLPVNAMTDGDFVVPAKVPAIRGSAARPVPQTPAVNACSNDAYSGGFGGNAFVAAGWQQTPAYRPSDASSHGSQVSSASNNYPVTNAGNMWCCAGRGPCDYCQPPRHAVSSCGTSSASYSNSRLSCSVASCPGCASCAQTSARVSSRTSSISTAHTVGTQRPSVGRFSVQAMGDTWAPYVPSAKHKKPSENEGKAGSKNNGSPSLIASGRASTTVVELTPGGVCRYGEPFPVDDRPVRADGKRKRKAYEGLHNDPNLKRYMENHEGLPTKTIDQYDMLVKIGQGTFGEVFKALSKGTHEVVALKKVQLTQADHYGIPATSVREIRILSTMKHPNVLQLFDMARSGPSPLHGNRSFLYLVLEFCDHDLVGLVNQRESSLPDGIIKEILWQLLNGLYYIHAQCVLHRDLKLANILVTKDGVVKIADFGLARWYDPNDTTRVMSNGVVTLWYRPPELLLGSMRYDDKIDMWGAGCMMAEIFTKEPLFPGREELEEIDLIQNICGPVRPADFPEPESMAMLPTVLSRQPVAPKPRHVKQHLSRWVRDRSALDLVDHLLQMNPNRRFRADDAMMHDYFFSPPHRGDLKDFVSKFKNNHHEWTSKRKPMVNPVMQQPGPPPSMWRGPPPPGLGIPRPQGGAARVHPVPPRGHPGAFFGGARQLGPPVGMPQPLMARRGGPPAPPRGAFGGPQQRAPGPGVGYIPLNGPSGSNRSMEEPMGVQQMQHGSSGRRQVGRMQPTRAPAGGGGGGSGRGLRGHPRASAARVHGGMVGEGFSDIIY